MTTIWSLAATAGEPAASVPTLRTQRTWPLIVLSARALPLSSITNRLVW